MTSRDALLAAKDETITALQEQLAQAHERDRENRRIIAALTQRIPAIEAPQEASEAPEMGADATGEDDVPGAHSEAQEEARAWRLTRLQELFLVLIAIASLSALIYLAVTVLST